LKFPFLLFLLLFGIPVLSQGRDTSVAAQQGSDTVTVRLPDETALNKFRHDPEFNYREKEKTPTLLAYLLNYLRSFLGQFFGSWTGLLLWKVIIAVILLAVLLFFFFGIRNRAGGLFLNNKTFASQKAELNIQEIGNQDIDALINEALAEKNFRIAVHYLYLSILQLLAKKKFIQLRIEKTNHEYIRELKDSSYYDEFGQLTLLFEWMFYGEAITNDESMANTVARFRQFQKTLADTI
jgi:hypothetical protein